MLEKNISLKQYTDLQKKMRELELENEILKKLQPYSPENNNSDSCFYNV